MSNKVKLPREVAQAIDDIRCLGMCDHALYDRKWLTSDIDDGKLIKEAKETILGFIDRNDDRFDPSNQLMTYYRALVNGYEVEETPQEKVIRLYNTPNVAMYNPSSYKAGVMDALNALGMVIEGVNA